MNPNPPINTTQQIVTAINTYRSAIQMMHARLSNNIDEQLGDALLRLIQETPHYPPSQVGLWEKQASLNEMIIDRQYLNEVKSEAPSYRYMQPQTTIPTTTWNLPPMPHVLPEFMTQVQLIDTLHHGVQFLEANKNNPSAHARCLQVIDYIEAKIARYNTMLEVIKSKGILSRSMADKQRLLAALSQPDFSRRYAEAVQQYVKTQLGANEMTHFKRLVNGILNFSDPEFILQVASLQLSNNNNNASTATGARATFVGSSSSSSSSSSSNNNNNSINENAKKKKKQNPNANGKFQ